MSEGGGDSTSVGDVTRWFFFFNLLLNIRHFVRTISRSLCFIAENFWLSAEFFSNQAARLNVLILLMRRQFVSQAVPTGRVALCEETDTRFH